MLVAALAERFSRERPADPTVGRRLVVASRVALGAVVVVALPGFVAAVADIVRA